MNPVEPGKWYAIVPCDKCKRGIAFKEVPSPDEEPELLATELTVPCPHCGHVGIYQPEQFERGQGRYRQ